MKDSLRCEERAVADEQIDWQDDTCHSDFQAPSEEDTHLRMLLLSELAVNPN